MREIKFRAWNKKKRKLLEVWNIKFRLDYREEINGAVDSISVKDDGIDEIDDFILMQYTGLKDKNGKEIYEGDILEVNVELDNKKICHQVKYYENGFFLFQLNGLPSTFLIHSEYLNQHKIIGNIYENPELKRG